MEFVETEEFKEFKKDLKLMIKMWRKNFIAYLFWSVLTYILFILVMSFT